MSLALELDQDQRSTLEQIWKERQASGKVRPPMAPPPEPKAADEPAPPGKCWPGGLEARVQAFAAAVAAKHKSGNVVTIHDATAAGGCSEPTAVKYIARLRELDAWPYAKGVSRRGPAKPRPGKPRPAIPDFELPKSKVIAKPVVEAAPAATPVVARPPVVVEAKPEPVSPPSGIGLYDAIDSWGLNYHLGVVVERVASYHVSVEDLRRARWHLDREIARRERKGAAS